MGTMRTWMVVVLTLLVSGAVADAAKVKRVRKRKAVQKSRIKSGVKDGSLTKREAGRLAREQKRISKMAKDAAADGKVTGKEKAILERNQDRASAHIVKERHDAQGTMGSTPNRKTWDPGVNQRQRIQHRRIAQGIRSGSLTRAETRQIIQTESRIRKMEHAMKSDGVLTKNERQHLHAALSQASKEIFALKHNDASRPNIHKVLKAKIASGELTGAEARDVLAKLRRLHEIKRVLGGPVIDADKRAELQDEFAELAGQLFE